MVIFAYTSSWEWSLEPTAGWVMSTEPHGDLVTMACIGSASRFRPSTPCRANGEHQQVALPDR